MIELLQKDFKCIGQVAMHCNLEKLNIAISEAIKFDGRALLCGLFNDVSANWRSKEKVWADLINGGDYIGCNNVTAHHAGLKEVLVYYAYARYLVINNTDDTASGTARKTNQFSIPTPMKEIYSLSNRYRNMAAQLWKDTEAFICLNRDDYKGANLSNCSSCGCNGGCGERSNTRGFGISGKNVSKYGM